MSLFDTGIRPAVDAWLLEKSKEVRSYGEYWSASSAGYCQRKVLFERLGVPYVVKEDDARKQRIFTAGHIFHQWMQEITKEAGLSIAQELELQDEELMIRGHIDDLVLIKPSLDELKEMRLYEALNRTTEEEDRQARKDMQHLILYDYKTVNSRSFMWAKKNGNAMNYSHRMQLGTYMYMLRKHKDLSAFYGMGLPIKYDALTDLTEARILKIEKENMMMMEQQLMWDAELESEVVSYWKSLNTHWKNKTLPKCTCSEHDGGFMANEKYNPFWFDGEPCSLEWYKLNKKEGKLK